MPELSRADSRYMALRKNTIRNPNVAGTFYEKEPDLLRSRVTSFLNSAKGVPNLKQKHICAIIVPHAGYIYCGSVMASAYQLLTGKKYDRIILIGPSHFIEFQSVALDSASAWKTPLGTIPLDQTMMKQFPKHTEFAVQPGVFDHEHSLEVQIPFIQAVLPSASLIPLCIGQDIPHTRIAETISPLLTNTTLIVVSSDFSHYHPEEEANTIDKDSITAILSKNPDWIDTTVDACGLTGIKILNDLAVIHHWKPHLLTYQTSGDVTREHEAVVGYASFAYAR